MERTFPEKSVTLIANTAATITWGAPDFGPRFYESIIKRNVALRFTCTSTTANSVNVGVQYTTLTKTYQIAERQTLFVIPPNKSIEITAATIPALALLYENITSITVNLISASSGIVTISLIIDDEPPPLTTDPGDKIGLDAKLNLDYITINIPTNSNIIAGTTTTLFTYLVPPGKRFILDLLTGYLPPTPSYPEYLQMRFYLPDPSLSMIFMSKTAEGYTFTALQNSGYIFNAGDLIKVDCINFDTTAWFVRTFMIGREIY